MNNREKLRSSKQKRHQRLLTQSARKEDSPIRESAGRHNRTITSSPVRNSLGVSQNSTSDSNSILKRSAESVLLKSAKMDPTRAKKSSPGKGN